MEKRKYAVFAVGFIIILCLFATVSDYKLIDYYANDVPYNEYWNPDLGRKNESDYSTVFFGKRWFVDINGAVRNALVHRYMNNVVKLNNGQLTALKYPIDEATLQFDAGTMHDLYDCCCKLGIPFIYIATPDKVSKYDPELPTGYDDYSNQNCDIFLKYLEQYHVPYIDMREEFHSDGLDQYDFFSRTDHHWTSYGGYYCYTKIIKWLDKNEIIYDAQASDRRNYSVTTYPGKLLGSWGQRTGKYFSGSDDLNVFRPLFETSVTRLSDEATGTYDDVMLNDFLLNNSKPEFIYDALYNNMYNFTNNIVENDTSILLIGDSFSRVVNPFLVLSEKNFMFLSCYDHQSVTVSYLDSTKPDAVILLQSPWNNLGWTEEYVPDAPQYFNDWTN